MSGSGAFCPIGRAMSIVPKFASQKLERWPELFKEETSDLTEKDRLEVAIAISQMLLKGAGQAGHQTVLVSYLVTGSVDEAFKIYKKVLTRLTAGRPKKHALKNHAESGPKVVNSENRITTIEGFRSVWTQLFGGDRPKVTSDVPRKKLEKIAKEHGILASGKVGELVEKINRLMLEPPLLQRIIDTPHEYRVDPDIIRFRPVDEFDFF